jgi:cobalamin-dependent methionine synthase I
MTDKIVEQWWHDNMTPLTAQLSNGVLNEMKRRIENSNIRKQKLTLDENTERMTAFFKAEIQRYQKRKDTQKKRQAELEKLDLFKRIIKQLVDCNLSLARKCKTAGIAIEKVRICEQKASSWK